MDNVVVEDIEENFTLEIRGVSPDSVDPTAGNIPTATVTITDNDGMLRLKFFIIQ